MLHARCADHYNEDVIEPPPFSSECPKCGHDRVQTGYAQNELADLLKAGADIEAYCINCDASWPISTEERADLARALSKLT
jgi:hypothetical protein